IALEQPVREIAPADALADECDLRLGLDCQLALDLLGDAYDGRAGQLGERGAAVAEDPRIAVLVGADRSHQTGARDRARENIPGARVAPVPEGRPGRGQERLHPA